MYISKKIKSVLLSASLTLGLSALITANAYAYTPGTAIYTAVSGDSLYKISRVFHTTVDTLMNDNDLKNYSLNIGQKLKVPGDTYTVQRGDTLFLIAQKYKLPLAELQRANNIYTDKLDVGQLLAVPSISPAYTPSPIPAPAPTPAPAPAPTPAPAASYSAEDLDLLARLIMAETQSEPYDAKVAVGAVVMNRVESGLFTDTVRGVIYQKYGEYYQFTPVANGWIDRPANADCINAAKDALNGVDPTNGALWYYDDSTTNQFMLAKKVSVKIGHMVFAY